MFVSSQRSEQPKRTHRGFELSLREGANQIKKMVCLHPGRGPCRIVSRVSEDNRSTLVWVISNLLEDPVHNDLSCPSGPRRVSANWRSNRCARENRWVAIVPPGVAARAPF